VSLGKKHISEKGNLNCKNTGPE